MKLIAKIHFRALNGAIMGETRQRSRTEIGMHIEQEVASNLINILQKSIIRQNQRKLLLTRENKVNIPI